MTIFKVKRCKDTHIFYKYASDFDTLLDFLSIRSPVWPKFIHLFGQKPFTHLAKYRSPKEVTP